MMIQWTIYDHPIDMPDMFVARQWEVDKGGYRPTVLAYACAEIEPLRETMKNMGLVCITRSQGDDPTIVEDVDMTEHTYPDGYPRDATLSLAAAWDILDRLAPGQVDDTSRAFIAGSIAGMLDKVNASWRETLRIERDARLHASRQADLYRDEVMQYRRSKQHD